MPPHGRRAEGELTSSGRAAGGRHARHPFSKRDLTHARESQTETSSLTRDVVSLVAELAPHLAHMELRIPRILNGMRIEPAGR